LNELAWCYRLLKESLEQKQADVKAVIKEYEAKVEETQAKMRQEYDMVVSILVYPQSPCMS